MIDRSESLPQKVTAPVLIAGFGNVLRGDDGFGVEVLRRLEKELPADHKHRLIEVGIGGIALIQELMDGFESLVIVDALSGQPAGEVIWSRLEVADYRERPPVERRQMLADIHFANPNRALTLARALDLLPAKVYLLGCRVDAENPFGMGLSRTVSSALSLAVQNLLRRLPETC